MKVYSLVSYNWDEEDNEILEAVHYDEEEIVAVAIQLSSERKDTNFKIDIRENGKRITPSRFFINGKENIEYLKI